MNARKTRQSQEDKDLAENLIFVFNELKANHWYRQKITKKIKRLSKRGELRWDLDGSNEKSREWAFRVCCADLAHGRYRWRGWETRSSWAWRLANEGMCYPAWNGRPCKLLVLAEQGIGDEILYASVFNDLLKVNPDVTVECDQRLMPVYRESFPTIKFINRFRNKERESKLIRADYAPGEYDAFIPLADLVKMFRKSKEDFDGRPYLKAKNKFFPFHTTPVVGISWKGRQGFIDPKELMVDENATYVSLQYDSDPPDFVASKLGMAEGPERNKIFTIPGIDLKEDIISVFALIKAVDYVVTIPTSVAHIAGSIGKQTHVVRPPPIYPGDKKEAPGFHNKLRYEWGLWTGRIPWYSSVRTYKDIQTFRRKMT